ncbi:hypothetical protein BG20_I2243 [Candidatus Nitrosarchaeum limnium BG20]|uniref:Uncharacterized protein n=1 Tax=Candidatus Nitrosarchaeum limnium BG20 TaxID=859192 RepID=S2EKM4_9ARCH|nr:hypothetical protein BG20_I2243 [Candidatus Nitrosarchaeum limnium BG20]
MNIGFRDSAISLHWPKVFPFLYARILVSQASIIKNHKNSK